MSSWQSVFIYGTLKTGQFNDHVIQDPNRGQARLVGRVRTLEPWPLVSITKFKLTNIPALLDKQGVGKVGYAISFIVSLQASFRLNRDYIT